MNTCPTLPEESIEDSENPYCVLQEAIVGAFGLPSGQLHVSIKGDPSLRESVPIRQRYKSRMDVEADRVLDVCEYLLTETGVYNVYLGFNSSEVRTESVFNPFSYEIHDADSLLKQGYARRHFVRVPYAEKTDIIRSVREFAQTGPVRHYLPEHWKNLMDRQRAAWQPINEDHVGEIVHSLNMLRGIEGYYLRNAATSLAQGMVRASFNCDGTYIVSAEFFPQFVQQNTP